MSYIDLHSALRDWPYDPEKISVRKIQGVDGAVRMQLRVELGIIQMQVDGRPDGTLPCGFGSLLEYHQQRLARHTERNGTPLGYAVQPRECEALRLEASLYYRRYVGFFVLEEFDGVVRDTDHSLKIFDLCRDYAMDPADGTALEEYRPYVLMMHARGQAFQAIAEGQPASALAHVNRGILAIKSHLEQSGPPELLENCDEIAVLRTLSAELDGQMPDGSILVTRKALREAIEQEHFEEAARLRDELRNLYPPTS